MAGTLLVNAALAQLEATLATISGLPVTRDPRNITPGCVLIGAPTVEPYNYNVVDMTVPCLVISSGPGNQDALDQLLTIVAQVLAKNVGMTLATPTNVTIGGTEAPGYELTIKMQAQTS